MLDENDYNKSIEKLERAIGLYPNFIEANHNHAIAYEKKGEPLKAIERYQKILNFKEDCLPALQQGSYLCFKYKPYDRADSTIKRALLISPGWIDGYLALAEIYQVKGERDEEERMYRRILDIDPNHGPAHYRLALLYNERNKLEEVEAHFPQSLNRLSEVSSKVHYLLGLLYLKRNQIKRAQDSLKKSLEMKE